MPLSPLPSKSVITLTKHMTINYGGVGSWGIIWPRIWRLPRGSMIVWLCDVRRLWRSHFLSLQSTKMWSCNVGPNQAVECCSGSVLMVELSDMRSVQPATQINELEGLFGRRGLTFSSSRCTKICTMTCSKTGNKHRTGPILLGEFEWYRVSWCPIFISIASISHISRNFIRGDYLWWIGEYNYLRIFCKNMHDPSPTKWN